ncbi:hypothetical protein KC19_4G049200 [Ceratodon purpureus]|uniref:Secreted protein n=1 Tax=Ceratodon purpureus TaxID=3225 RepID=A0A8T0I6V2_CERPU|nr:hypothetical protein KC19_4G049200 [Ceratodon purpureus]
MRFAGRACSLICFFGVMVWFLVMVPCAGCSFQERLLSECCLKAKGKLLHLGSRAQHACENICLVLYDNRCTA